MFIEMLHAQLEEDINQVYLRQNWVEIYLLCLDFSTNKCVVVHLWSEWKLAMIRWMNEFIVGLLTSMELVSKLILAKGNENARS